MKSNFCTYKVFYQLLTFFFLISVYSFGQEPTIIFDKATTFQLNEGTKDSINFIVASKDISEKKPVFLFCQGSLPLPMFMQTPPPQSKLFFFGGGLSNFDLKKLNEKYHVVVISMPYTPLVTEYKNEHPQSWYYIPDQNQPYQLDSNYLAHDYLQHYVERGVKVIDFLSKQDWVDLDTFVAFGHSQGSKVATKLAKESKIITHLGLSGANPFGRIDQYIRSSRAKAENGIITWEEAEESFQENYNYYKHSFDPDSVAKHDYYKTINSFSEPLFDDWLSLSIPIYLTYGTLDQAATLCDIVPLLFMEKRKDNLTIKRWLGTDHNYFPVDEQGKPEHQNGKWKEVIYQFTDWVESPSSTQ